MQEKTLTAIKLFQKNEITEYRIYSSLAKQIKDQHNKEILQHIAADELRHAQFWQSLSGHKISPNHLVIVWYAFIAKVFGLSFGLKLMERGEKLAQKLYNDIVVEVPEAQEVMDDEHRHEAELLDMLSERKLDYAGSIVLGLNDALVELTGALTGLTFALSNPRLIAVTGLVTGIAASLSMAASGYLQSREEDDENKNPITSAIYTGVTYIITVAILIAPYLLLNNVYLSWMIMLIASIVIIASYTFYITTAKSQKFGRRFLEMAAISLGVAIITFGIGSVIRLLGIAE